MAHRTDKINESVSREITDILRSVKDPRVSSAFISVTGVSVSNDLSFAKVYYSVLGSNANDREIAKGLDSASGYIRSELAARLNLRVTPKLSFVKDNTAERAMRISDILKKIEYSDSSDSNEGGEC